MKKILLLTQFFFFSVLTFAQCEDISFLTQFFNESLEKQDQLLETKGFTIDRNYGDGFGMEWANIKYHQYISIRRNDENKVDRVQYRLGGDNNCYEELKSKLSLQGFNKEFETIGLYSTFYFFYKSDKYGLILSKWKAPGGLSGNFYQIEIHSLESYYNELEKRK